MQIPIPTNRGFTPPTTVSTCSGDCLGFRKILNVSKTTQGRYNSFMCHLWGTTPRKEGKSSGEDNCGILPIGPRTSLEASLRSWPPHGIAGNSPVTRKGSSPTFPGTKIPGPELCLWWYLGGDLSTKDRQLFSLLILKPKSCRQETVHSTSSAPWWYERDLKRKFCRYGKMEMLWVLKCATSKSSCTLSWDWRKGLILKRIRVLWKV